MGEYLKALYDGRKLFPVIMGEYSKALSSHETALEMRKKTLSGNHPDLATSYNNIGLVYDHMGEYSKALSSHETALEMQKRTLSDLATQIIRIWLPPTTTLAMCIATWESTQKLSPCTRQPWKCMRKLFPLIILICAWFGSLSMW